MEIKKEVHYYWLKTLDGIQIFKKTEIFPSLQIEAIELVDSIEEANKKVEELNKNEIS